MGVPFTRKDFESLSELELLRALVAGEAATESDLGQRAICFVVLNRVAYSRLSFVKWWPASIHGVILAPRQFSCFDDPGRYREMMQAASLARAPDQWMEKVRSNVSSVMFSEPGEDITLGADHYYSDIIKPPSWVRPDVMTLTVKIGRHRFYRSIGF